MILYVGHLINENQKSSTIKSYISAVKSVLRAVGEQITDDELLLTALIWACRLKNYNIQTRLPIGKDLLAVMLNKMNKVFILPQPYLVIMYRALFATAYFGLFRVGELTMSQHTVKARDVHLAVNKQKLMFILWSSKTHTLGDKPQIIKIKALKETTRKDKKNACCPFRLLSDYIQIQKKFANDSEQFFIFSDRTPVEPKHFHSILKKLILLCRLNPALYGTHGFRAGRGSDLLKMGVSVETIRKIGRWKSTAVYTYLRS